MTGSEDDTHIAPAGGEAGSPFASGAEFAGHEIEAELGRGGMGIVYRARHLALGRVRALKVIAPALSADPSFRDRFRREARLAAAVEHPNLIPIHDAGEAEGHLYIAMRLVEGASLKDEIAAGPLEPERALSVVRQTAAALDAAHGAGLVHRDVKPANILLEGDHVFLTDFGISREGGADATITTTGQVLGSPDYVSPEQADAGVATPRSDLYSLGAVLYVALTGEAPFPRDSHLAKLNAHGHAERPKPSAVAPWLPAEADDLIARAMAVDPEERFASGAQFAAAAEPILRGAAGPPPSARRVEHRRLRWPAVGLAVAAIAVVAIVIALMGGDEETGSPDPPAAASAEEEPGSLAATIEVGAEPNGVTVGEGGVWVGSRGDEAVWEIDPATDRGQAATNTIPGGATSVATGFGSVWAVNGPGGAVLRFDPDSPAQAVTIATGADPSDVAVDEKWVWVANESEDSVARVDPSTNVADEVVPVGDSPRAIATGAGSVWVANIEGGSVSRIDPEAATTIGRPIEVGQRPNDLTVGEDFVWVVDIFEGTLTRLDPETGRVEGEPARTLAKPRAVSTGFGSVWVSSEQGTVGRVDPETSKVIGGPIRVGEEPGDLTVGGGSVWTANVADDTVSRIDPG